jgi:hypothetical protein
MPTMRCGPEGPRPAPPRDTAPARKVPRFGGGGYRDRAYDVLATTNKPGTVRTNQSALNAFRLYAIAEGVDLEAFRLAPSEGANLAAMSVRAMEIFEGFAVFMVEGRGTTIGTAKQYGRTVRTDISNETGWDLKAMGDSKWGRLTRLFAKLEKLHPGKTRIRKPILQQDLLRIRERLDLRQHEQAMCWAVLLMGFFGVNRGGDVLPQTQSGFDPECDACREDVSFEGDDLMLLDLRGNTKTGAKTNEFDFKPYVRDRGNPLCPVTAYMHYISLDPTNKGENRRRTPLFRHKNGKSVSTKDVVKFLKREVAAIGLDPDHYSGHSVRIGGATAALSCPSGDEYTVKVMGYWLGEAVRLYTRPTREMVTALQREMMRSRHTRVAGQ